ncbi:MAG: PRD domain-containing protein [Bulleidia sp.]|nr:PRD domain-containing protein [Bulleidia sp.]
MIDEIPQEYFRAASAVYTLAEKELGEKLHEQLIMNLADHIWFMIRKMDEDEMQFSEMFLFDEISIVYPKEYAVGVKAYEMLQEMFHKELPREEICYLTFHIVNAEEKDITKSPRQLMDFVKDILDTVMKVYPEIEGKKESVEMSRFIIHLRFLGNRVLRKEHLDGEDEALLKVLMRDARVYSCITSIDALLEEKYGYTLSSLEKAYLIIHLRQVIQ